MASFKFAGRIRMVILLLLMELPIRQFNSALSFEIGGLTIIYKTRKQKSIEILVTATSIYEPRNKLQQKNLR